MTPQRPRTLPLARIVDWVAPRLAGAIGDDAFDWLRVHGAAFGVTTNCILELSPCRGTVDFAMPAFAEDASLHELAGAAPASAMCGRLVGHPSFAALRPLAAGALQHADPPALWLEWDAPVAGAAPAVSAYIEAPIEGEAADADARARLLAQLGPGPASLHAVQRLLDATARLPGGTHAKYFGRMLGRGAPGLRLAAEGFGAAQVAPYLASIGWAHDRSAIDRWLQVLREFWTPLAIQVDVEDDLVDRLGLNVEHPGPFAGTPFWREMFARFVAAGVAHAALYPALCAWDGHLEDSGEELFLRVNHVKISIESGQAALSVYLSILRY